MKVLFIGGVDRSGTTALAAELGKICGGVVTPESQFKKALVGINYSSDSDLERVAQRIWSEPHFPSWKISHPLLDAILFKNREGGAARVLMHLVAAYGHLSADENLLWIDHTPTNFRSFSFLRATFPHARFIHLVRNPKAVYSSVRKCDWGPSSPVRGASWYLERIAPCLLAELIAPSVVKRVYFEEFVRESGTVFGSIGEWIGASPSRSERLELPAYTVPAYSRHQHRLVGDAPVLERIDGWKKELPEREARIFETRLGEFCELLGYQRDFQPAQPRSDETIQWFVREEIAGRLRDYWHKMRRKLAG